MTARYHCPITTCRWSHNTAVTNPTPYWSTDPLRWTASNWTDATRWIEQTAATAHLIDGHLATHSPVEWMTEMRRLHDRIDAAEKLIAQMSAMLPAAAHTAGSVDPVTAPRMPSRAEVESVRVQIAGLLGTAVCDV